MLWLCVCHSFLSPARNHVVIHLNSVLGVIISRIDVGTEKTGLVDVFDYTLPLRISLKQRMADELIIHYFRKSCERSVVTSDEMKGIKAVSSNN